MLASWLTEPFWDLFAALLPQRPEFDPAHPLARSFCLRRRTPGVRQGVFGCLVSAGLPRAVSMGSVCESAARSRSFSSLSLSLSG